MAEKRKLSWKPFAIFGMVIVFPLLSWYYLQQGANFQMVARSELKDYGKTKTVSSINEQGQKTDLLEGKISVIHHFEKGGVLQESDKAVIDLYSGLFNQFKDRPEDFRLVVVDHNPSAELRNYMLTKDGLNNPMWIISQAEGSWSTILMNGFEYYLMENNRREFSPYVALSDTSGTIRNFYDPNSKSDVQRMVQHIALLLPNR